MGQEICMCVCEFSALIITQARLEIGVLLELSSYPDFVWCDFLYLGKRQAQVSSHCQNIISPNQSYLSNRQWVFVLKRLIQNCCQGFCEERINYVVASMIVV